MSVKLKDAKIEIDVVRLSSIDKHLFSTASVLHDILSAEIGNKHEKSDVKKPEETETGYPCHICRKHYKSLKTLNTHEQLKHPSEDGIKIRCDSCDKTYASSLSLHKHVRYMHKYEHRCNVCYRTFPSMRALEQHGEICLKFETPCPKCRKIYSSMLSLKNHMKYKHPKEQTNICHICRRTFRSSRGLVNHIATIHPTTIKCDKCNKKFNSMPALQSHYIYKHAENGERCTLCRKAFASQSNLSRHLTKCHDIRVLYNGEQYWCGVCDSAFQCANDLLQHVKDLHPNKNEDIV